MTKRTEPYSATIMAVLAVAFCAWALTTLPLQGAVVLVLGWSGWMAFSYVRPVRSRTVIATYLCAVGFQLILIMSGLLIYFLIKENRILKAEDETARPVAAGQR
ncbi:hypothetical protein [Nonomuraea sp. NPDC049504]|uniref:hypothetical protein n=1 Tax=Nonomuraea sp. NPDC049504 TaxID=3154729 RepID=UPI003447FBCA